jgi:hypothetical protein
MAVLERDLDAVGRQVLEAGERVGREAWLRLLTVRDHRRAGGLEPLDGVAQRGVVQRA